MSGAVLQLKKLDVFHGNFHAVHGIDMTFGAGELVSVIGANGAGKSSVLKAIIGQVDRIGGEIEYDGHNLSTMETPERIALGLSLVPEGRRLFPSLSVEENLRIGLFTGRDGGMSLQDAYDMFPILQERRDQRANLLSGGQQQMVAIARSLLMNPRIILFDEISLGLSPLIVQDIYKTLPKIREMGMGIVVVEQDISRSLDVADRFYCLLEGRVTLSGKPKDVSREDVANSYFGISS